MTIETDLARLMPAVAELLLGEPNTDLSSKGELRFGTRGSVSVVKKKGVFFDHEAGKGGGVLALIEHVTGCKGKARWDWLRDNGFDVESNSKKPNGKANGHAKPDEDKARKLALARRIASEARDIRGTPAEAYLRSRGINVDRLPSTRDLRFHPGDGKRHLPAFVTLVRRSILRVAMVVDFSRREINSCCVLLRIECIAGR